MLNTKIRGQQINLSDEALDVAVDSIAFKDADDAIKVDTIADLMTAIAGDGVEASSGVLAVDLKANDGLKIDTGELTIAYDDSTIGIIGNELAVKDDGITMAKLETGTNAQMIICDASGNPTYVAVSGGDVSIDNAGLATIGATKVTDAMLNDDVATGLAGVGLSASAGVLAVDLQEVDEVAITVADDYMVLLDGGISGATKKEKFADIVDAIAGEGLTATAGVLSVDAIANNLDEADIQMENLSADIEASGYSGEHTLSNTPVVNSVQVFLNGLLQEEGSGKDYTLTGAVIQFATQPVSGDIVICHYMIND